MGIGGVGVKVAGLESPMIPLVSQLWGACCQPQFETVTRGSTSRVTRTPARALTPYHLSRQSAWPDGSDAGWTHHRPPYSSMLR